MYVPGCVYAVVNCMNSALQLGIVCCMLLFYFILYLYVYRKNELKRNTAKNNMFWGEKSALV